ncbi:MAG: lipid A deacylase LpxR family protein [Alphaproteobacteria bacterium]
MPRRLLAALAVVCLPIVPAVAQTDDGIGTFVLENDLFTGRDDDYTNGIQIGYLSGADLVPIWVHDAAALLPFYNVKTTVRSTVTIGQAMYTPADIRLKDPPRDDRPYAGWLYTSIGLIAEDGDQLDQLQLSVGVVGPLSGAEQAQKFVHKVINSPRPSGWSKQLHNEPGVILTYQHSDRAFVSGEVVGFAFDATPHFGGAVGNVMTYANAGVTLRLGYHLPDDYGPPRIQPSLPGNGYFEATDDVGWYLFAGFDARLVARNIFLDGNTFGSSRSVDKRLVVGDAQVGAAITWRRFRLAYTHVFRTKEFGDEDTPDAFGALSLSVKF